ncbi:uncharacterized protein TNCV_3356021 [Trichonephila clavipes]|nr:uncharacterized protein TNCV_3356021 [Trichonephila clavipes]
MTFYPKDKGRGSLVVKVSHRGRHVMSSSPVPLKTRRVGQRCMLNLSRAQMSCHWCGVVVRREGCQLRCSPRHLIMAQNDERNKANNWPVWHPTNLPPEDAKSFGRDHKSLFVRQTLIYLFPKLTGGAYRIGSLRDNHWNPKLHTKLTDGAKQPFSSRGYGQLDLPSQQERSTGKRSNGTQTCCGCISIAGMAEKTTFSISQKVHQQHKQLSSQGKRISTNSLGKSLGKQSRYFTAIPLKKKPAENKSGKEGVADSSADMKQGTQSLESRPGCEETKEESIRTDLESANGAALTRERKTKLPRAGTTVT